MTSSTTTVSRLNPEIKSKWLEALRSGDYEQGDGLLHYSTDGEHHFCCLGVLCDLAVKEGVIEETDARTPSPDDDARADRVYDYLGTATMPPSLVENWAIAEEEGSDPRSAWYVPTPDIDDDDSVFAGRRTVSLAELNDEAHFTFAQIADVIEAYL